MRQKYTNLWNRTLTASDKPHYVPPWTDPDWQDEGQARQQTEWCIRDPVMDRVRPALLPKDQARHPTIYSDRFGIFPGRTDGRSRTSPTRSESRRVVVDGSPRTGASVFAAHRREAALQGQTLEDFLLDRRPNIDALARGDGDPQGEALRDLLGDEFWQAMRFGDLTMDELLANHYFSMGEAECDLTGPLHPLLGRHMWVTSDKWPRKQKVNRKTVHRLDGVHTEFDVQHDDELWEALQPALQLSTRLLDAKDHKLRAIFDITKRCPIPADDDHRPRADKAKGPGFRIKVDARPEDCVPTQSQAKPSQGFNAIRNSIIVLADWLQIRIADTRYVIEGKFKNDALFGYTTTGLEDFTEPITITLGANMIWRLMSKQHSSAEKIMTSAFIAHVIVHEFMHAFGGAAQRWVTDPSFADITDQADIDFCAALSQELWPSGLNTLEHYFEADVSSEMGCAYEEHILGGQMWPVDGSQNPLPQPPLAEGYAGITLLLKHVLSYVDHPHGVRVGDRAYLAFVDVEDNKKLFRNSFWDNCVHRYGMAAIREAPGNPAKVRLLPWTTLDDESDEEVFKKLHFGTGHDRTELIDYMTRLQEDGRRSLVMYIQSLLFEAHHFQFLVRQWTENTFQWAMDDRAKEKASEICMEACLATTAVYWDGGSFLNEEDPVMKEQFRKWKWHREVRERVPQDISTWDDFAQGLKTNVKTHEAQLVSKLMSLSNLLQADQEYQESMLCELYVLSKPYWGHYYRALPGHQAIWKLRTATICESIDQLVEYLDPLFDLVPKWRSKWRAKMLRYRVSFQNILDMLDLEKNANNMAWRDSLPTVGMMRKSRRTQRERWYMIVKEEMLDLPKRDAREFEDFIEQFGKWLDIADYKAVTRYTDFNELGVAEKWLGLVDSVLQKEDSRKDPVEPLTGNALRQYVKALEWEVAESKASNLKRAEFLSKLMENEREAFRPKCRRLDSREHLAIFGDGSQPKESTENTDSSSGYAEDFGDLDVIAEALSRGPMNLDDDLESRVSHPTVSNISIQNHPTPLGTPQGPFTETRPGTPSQASTADIYSVSSARPSLKTLPGSAVQETAPVSRVSSGPQTPSVENRPVVGEDLGPRVSRQTATSRSSRSQHMPSGSPQVPSVEAQPEPPTQTTVRRRRDRALKKLQLRLKNPFPHIVRGAGALARQVTSPLRRDQRPGVFVPGQAEVDNVVIGEDITRQLQEQAWERLPDSAGATAEQQTKASKMRSKAAKRIRKTMDKLGEIRKTAVKDLKHWRKFTRDKATKERAEREAQECQQSVEEQLSAGEEMPQILADTGVTLEPQDVVDLEQMERNLNDLLGREQEDLGTHPETMQEEERGIENKESEERRKDEYEEEGESENEDGRENEGEKRESKNEDDVRETQSIDDDMVMAQLNEGFFDDDVTYIQNMWNMRNRMRENVDEDDEDEREDGVYFLDIDSAWAYAGGEMMDLDEEPRRKRMRDEDEGGERKKARLS